MANDAPRQGNVQCLSRSGIHRMAYVEWGEPDNPNVLVCAHGLTRVGRDFDRLARALRDRYRVVCPDVVGRGRSEWLRDPGDYGLPQYVADMVTLIARLGVESVHWLGTSLGGLIGLTLAAQPGSPIKRLVLNDVGPKLNSEALARIGEYVGKPVRFATVDQAIDYVTLISLGFGLRDRDEWREATESVLKADGDAFTVHYDPKLALPIKAMTPQLVAAGEAALWKLYDQIQCPTLLIRGADSDLLSRETAAAMTQRGPRATLVEFPRVGHAPMFFDPAQIAVAREFLLST
jgi:pimeloyl-ACP methyl ester carboxylesterase